MKRLGELAKHKDSGSLYSWTLALCALTMAIYIMLLLAAFLKIDYSKQSLEDSITGAVMAGATVDRQRYSLTNNIYIQEPNAALQTFERFFGKAEGLTFSNHKGKSSGKTKSYYNLVSGKTVNIKRFIIYNVPAEPNASGHYIGEIYTWENGAWKISVKNKDFGKIGNDSTLTVQTPFGEKVDKTGVYVELEIPVKAGILGISNTINKGQLVFIETCLP